MRSGPLDSRNVGVNEVLHVHRKPHRPRDRVVLLARRVARPPDEPRQSSGRARHSRAAHVPRDRLLDRCAVDATREGAARFARCCPVEEAKRCAPLGARDRVPRRARHRLGQARGGEGRAGTHVGRLQPARGPACRRGGLRARREHVRRATHDRQLRPVPHADPHRSAAGFVQRRLVVRVIRRGGRLRRGGSEILRLESIGWAATPRAWRSSRSLDW